jgi:hypothetical protein
MGYATSEENRPVKVWQWVPPRPALSQRIELLRNRPAASEASERSSHSPSQPSSMGDATTSSQPVELCLAAAAGAPRVRQPGWACGYQPASRGVCSSGRGKPDVT